MRAFLLALLYHVAAVHMTAGENSSVQGLSAYGNRDYMLST